jgi:hypothetical protein
MGKPGNLPSVKIDLADYGYRMTVSLDGKELQRVKSVRVTGEAGDRSLVQLEMYADVRVQGVPGRLEVTGVVLDDAKDNGDD